MSLTVFIRRASIFNVNTGLYRSHVRSSRKIYQGSFLQRWPWSTLATAAPLARLPAQFFDSRCTPLKITSRPVSTSSSGRHPINRSFSQDCHVFGKIESCISMWAYIIAANHDQGGGTNGLLTVLTVELRPQHRNRPRKKKKITSLRKSFQWRRARTLKLVRQMKRTSASQLPSSTKERGNKSCEYCQLNYY